MPIPKKESSETNIKFLTRCMSDKVMVSEYPNEKQRFSVCVAQVENLRIARKTKKD